MDLRYGVAACQTDFPCPRTRVEIASRVDRMLEMVDHAVGGYAPFFPVRLVAFPEFAHAAPIYPTAAELRDKLAVPIPNEHTERYAARARQLGIYIQTGTFLEVDPKWPGAVFNTTCLVGPEGVLGRYRKVNPWIPWEVHASPHDIEGYDEELFPVADTPIGRLGAAICYDWLFPEAIRALQRAARLQPNLSRAHYRLAQLYQRTGQKEAAANELAIFRKLTGRDISHA